MQTQARRRTGHWDTCGEGRKCLQWGLRVQHRAAVVNGSNGLDFLHMQIAAGRHLVKRARSRHSLHLHPNGFIENTVDDRYADILVLR
jgi:hypothetical protein